MRRWTDIYTTKVGWVSVEVEHDGVRTVADVVDELSTPIERRSLHPNMELVRSLTVTGDGCGCAKCEKIRARVRKRKLAEAKRFDRRV